MRWPRAYPVRKRNSLYTGVARPLHGGCTPSKAVQPPCAGDAVSPRNPRTLTPRNPRARVPEKIFGVSQGFLREPQRVLVEVESYVLGVSGRNVDAVFVAGAFGGVGDPLRITGE